MGYSYAHEQARAEAMRMLVDGTLCAYCHRPMTKRMQLDYDHVVPMVLGGSIDGTRRLTHSHCNRSVGARIGNRLRNKNYSESKIIMRMGSVPRGSAKAYRKLPKW